MIQLLSAVIYLAFISLGFPDSLLGAGSVDAALDNYVALHFESKHMSWLHCFPFIYLSGCAYVLYILKIVK